MERDQARDDSSPARIGTGREPRTILPPPFRREADAVNAAPRDERPARAVPEPADQHRQQEVRVRDAARPCGCRRAGCRRSRAASATASCASVARSPAATRAAYGESKFCGKRESEQERDADRDVGVAGEVRVDLDRVRVDRDRGSRATSAAPARRRRRRRCGGEEVRDHDLLEQAGGDQVEGPARVDAARVARRLDLRDQLARPDDRARDEVREEGQVGGELLERRRARSRRGRCRRRS